MDVFIFYMLGQTTPNATATGFGPAKITKRTMHENILPEMETNPWINARWQGIEAPKFLIAIVCQLV